ncbi:MAG: hypothetical protein ACI9EW_003754 [Cellvibrionaceae bacterium]
MHLWQKASTAQNQLILNHSQELQILITQAFQSKADEDPYLIHFALDLLKSLSLTNKEVFLAQLLGLCSNGKYAGRAREAILSFPNDWLIENIEREAEGTLIHDDFLDWVNVLSVFAQIDLNLGRRLAKRMANHSDSELAVWGKEFIEDHA